MGLRPQGRASTVYLVVNADESEPGTCKDRELLSWDPHLLIEGMIIAVVRARLHARVHLHPRRDDARVRGRRSAAVDEAYAAGYLGKEHAAAAARFKLRHHVHRGAGAYICGEETALLNSLEGKRGWPRLKPPFPAVKGLFSEPTIVNNVETLMNVPDIIEQGRRVVRRARHGPLGRHAHRVRVGPRRQARRVRAADGHHRSRELIDDVCGGIPDGPRRSRA